MVHECSAPLSVRRHMEQMEGGVWLVDGVASGEKALIKKGRHVPVTKNPVKFFNRVIFGVTDHDKDRKLGNK